MKDLEEQIIEIVSRHTGPERPVSRATLKGMTGAPDRLIRQVIADLQAQGFWIVSLKRGYYLAQRSEDKEAYVRRERHRAYTILNKLRGFDPAVGKAAEQLELL